MNDAEGAVEYWTRTIQQWQRFSEAQLLRFAQRNFPEWHPQDHEHWVTGKKLIKETTVDGYRWAVPMWDEYIDKIPNPGVLVTGDVAQGSIVSPEYAAASLSRWKGLREIVHIPGAGHYIHHYEVEPIQRATRMLAEDVFNH
jgi:pimeloyl-ACP methyl ester carboxylesterase